MLQHGEIPIEDHGDVEPARHGPAEWREVDRRLREYARHRAALDAAESFDLVRAEQLEIYALCGCASLYDYLERVLGYTPHTRASGCAWPARSSPYPRPWPRSRAVR